jgi:hypothetical protein
VRGRLNTFLELKMENERLQQRLRNAKAKVDAMDRAQAQRSAYMLSQPASYGGPPHARAESTPSGTSFSWTLNAATPTPGRSFDSRPFYPGLADTANLGSTSGATAATASPSSAPPSSGEPTDPSADYALSRKKASPASACLTRLLIVSCLWPRARNRSRTSYIVVGSAGGRIRPSGERLAASSLCVLSFANAALQGPQGPKTLCNACGLRWAKTVRTNPSLAEGGENVNEG